VGEGCGIETVAETAAGALAVSATAGAADTTGGAIATPVNGCDGVALGWAVRDVTCGDD